jgi:hypothetical protein
MTMTNDRPDLSSEGAPDNDKTILVNVNRNKYPVVRPTWALNPGLTDWLVVSRNVTLTLVESVIGISKEEMPALGWRVMMAKEPVQLGMASNAKVQSVNPA